MKEVTSREKKDDDFFNQNEVLEKETVTSVEAYRKGRGKRRRKSFLFILFLFAEMILSIVLIDYIQTEDLYYRVSRQIENSLYGKNFFNTGIYSGATDFGYFVGEGTFNYNTGSVYSGQFSDKYIQGLGRLLIPNEGIYEGSFIESKKNGTGVFTWDDGSIYNGEWKNDQMSGKGIYTSWDGTEYIGIFSENKFVEGACNFTNDTGSYSVEYKDYTIDNLNVLFSDGSTYDGSSDGEYISGIGTLRFSNGDKYTGHFENGVRSGQGIYIWNNGDEYGGLWENDAMTGIGCYTYADGSCAEGVFIENTFVEGSYKVINTFGEYNFTIKNQEAISVNMELKGGTKYSGNMENGKLTGQAQITYSNGDTYSGRVNDGFKTGQGVYTWISGASYDGDWLNDKMEGQGTYFYPQKEKGYKLVGNFSKGLPNGKCQYYLTESESYETDWKKGKCIKVYE